VGMPEVRPGGYGREAYTHPGGYGREVYIHQGGYGRSGIPGYGRVYTSLYASLSTLGGVHLPVCLLPYTTLGIPPCYTRT